jgi:hypothetical protein
MLVIWGSTTRRVEMGTAADWCPDCRKARAFSVTLYFRVGHIYFVPLGRSRWIASIRECWECGAQFHVDEDDYDDFLSEEEAERRSLAQLLLPTNRKLKRELDSRRQGRPKVQRDSENVPEIELE